jgi:universal stress protein E
MNPIRNILVIVDPTAKEHPAVIKGAVLAEKFASRLELFICDTKASRNVREAEHARTAGDVPFVSNLKPMLESLAEPLRERGLDVTIEAVCADPLHEALVDRVKRTSAELVIKDTHHHTLAQRTFLTNTDWELIRACPVPLLLTTPTPWGPVITICAAVDPGHKNDRPLLLDHSVLEEASAFAQRLQGELHVLHAYLPLSVVAAVSGGPTPITMDLSPQTLAVEHEIVSKRLQPLLSRYEVAAENVHLELGGSADVICRLADRLGADIVAMGAVSRSGVKRVFIGSTAEDVLERLPCDALICKAPDFAEVLAL